MMSSEQTTPPMQTPHKILILLSVDQHGEEHEMIPDAVRGEPCLITLEVRNIGETPFPSGHVTNMMVRFQVESGPNIVTTITKNKLPDIPILGPGGSRVLDPVEFIPITDGIAWVSASISSDDERPVRLYQTPEYEQGAEWGQFFYVASKELVAISDQLGKLIRQEATRG